MEIAGPPDITVPLPKPVLPLDIPRGARGHLSVVRNLRRMIYETRSHVVHAHGLRAGVDAGVTARTARTPSALTVHNLLKDEIQGHQRVRLLRGTEAVATSLARLVFAPSREIALHLKRAAPFASSRIEVMYLAPERPPVNRSSELVRAELGLSESHLLALTVTRLVPQKALHVMLEAFARVPSNFVLAVVGEGRLNDQLRSQAAQLGLRDRVRWLGWRDDVGDLIAAADVFALSSVWEAVALAAQEAVQLGTPVVSTDVGGMSELITDGWSGRLVPAGDAPALAAALVEVAGTPTGRRFAARAADAYEENFSRARTLDRLQAAYRRLAHTRGA